MSASEKTTTLHATALNLVGKAKCRDWPVVIGHASLQVRYRSPLYPHVAGECIAHGGSNTNSCIVVGLFHHALKSGHGGRRQNDRTLHRQLAAHNVVHFGAMLVPALTMSVLTTAT